MILYHLTFIGSNLGSSIKGFHRLSCKTDQGINEFRNEFQQTLSQVKIHQSSWPKSWFQVKTELEQLTEPYIDYECYQAICTKANVNTKSAQTILLNFLCDLGISLYFQEHILEDTHVLEPKWVTKAVYKIINSTQVADNFGILYLNELEAILQPKDADDYIYPRNRYSYIIGLMKRFQLCYELKPNHSVLIPDLLQVEKPDFEFDYNQALQFRIEYRFLPRSIMPRFIVNRHQDIKEELRWRTGVVLTDNQLNATAIIVSDNEDRQISIIVNGDQRRDYFATILKTLRTIHNSFEIEKLGIDERVCLPDNPNATVSLKHLYKLENAGQNEYFPEGADKLYLVRELLGTVTENKEIKPEGIMDSLLLKPSMFGIGVDLQKLSKHIPKFNKK